jgi:hypothetical protein
MFNQQEMAMDIAYWIEACGYDEVLSAMISACQYWATTGDEPPIECDSDRWERRESALRRAQRETE